MSTIDSHPLPDPLIELIAQRFRVLADPMRIKILDGLREGPATVKELTTATGSSQQNVSKHLGVLHTAGLVAREKDGNFVRYVCSDPGVFELCEQVCGGLRRQLAALDEILAAPR
jgi:DNA-binding transcriptional ArsR family regulator